MKRSIILLPVRLISACLAVKSAKTLSSMQTNPMVEPVPEKTETVIETPKVETTALSTTEFMEPATSKAVAVIAEEATVEPITAANI